MAVEMRMAGILLRLLNARKDTGDINALVLRPVIDRAHPPKHEMVTMIQQCSPHSGLIKGEYALILSACIAAAAPTTGVLNTLLYQARSSVCVSLSPSSCKCILVSTAYSVVERRCAAAQAMPSMFVRMSWPQYAPVPSKMVKSR